MARTAILGRVPPQTQLTLPDGRTVVLRRHPSRPQPDNLRAWDAADELVLAWMSGDTDGLLADDVEAPVAPDSVETAHGRTVLVNDRFGALAVGLADRHPASWADSALTWEVTRANLVANGLEPTAAEVVPASNGLPPVGVAVVKVPRAKATLEWQLREIAEASSPGTVVVGAGMTREVHTSTVELFERILGPTVTTRARKKARLLLVQVDPVRIGTAPDHDVVLGETTHESHGVTVVALPGVFGAGATDDGTGLLLAHLPTVLPPAGTAVDVVDLGCGTGIVGTVVARDNPDARLVFTDVSDLAVASARRTLARTLPDAEATFHVADGLTACADGSADLVVVNPPFHEGRVVTDDIAWEMFGDARRVLRPGGRIVVVGNRHLAYHAKLKRLFGNVEVLGSDPRFVVMSAVRM